MIKIIISSTLSISIFLTIFCIFPQISNANPTVDSTCQMCHTGGDLDLHEDHDPGNMTGVLGCFNCHTFGVGNLPV